jgi:long-chain fatty acid transport protein
MLTASLTCSPRHPTFRVWIPALIALVGFSALAHASGFALNEDSAKDTGRAYAGSAAKPDGATAVYYNPALLTLLKKPQFNFTGTLIKLNAEFSPTSAVDAIGQPLSGDNGGNGGQKLNFVPSIFYSAPINHAWSWGVGIYVPFGLNTDYDASSILRYEAVYTSLSVINFNPTLAYRISNHFSVGAGVDISKANAKLTNAIDSGAVCFSKLGPINCTSLGLTPQSHDMYSAVVGSDTAFGWNIGFLWHAHGTRIGLAYRSRITHDLVGTASFSNVPELFLQSGLFSSTSASANIETPDTATLSFDQDLSRAWDISATASYTRWDSFNQIEVLFANPNQPPATTPEDYRNTWFGSVGTDWHYNAQWTFRGGLGWDESPVPNSTRNARLPDANRTWLALGLSYAPTPSTTLSFGYAHLFLNKHVPMDNVSPSGDQVIGTWDLSADLYALEFGYQF